MGIYQKAAWAVILGLALILVGGLVLWAYGARRKSAAVISGGVEGAAAEAFHSKLARWFFLYGTGVIVAGVALLLWATSVLFSTPV